MTAVPLGLQGRRIVGNTTGPFLWRIQSDAVEKHARDPVRVTHPKFQRDLAPRVGAVEMHQVEIQGVQGDHKRVRVVCDVGLVNAQRRRLAVARTVDRDNGVLGGKLTD